MTIYVCNTCILNGIQNKFYNNYRLDIFSTTKALQPMEIVKTGFHKAVMYRTICIYLHKVVIPLTKSICGQ